MSDSYEKIFPNIFSKWHDQTKNNNGTSASLLNIYPIGGDTKESDYIDTSYDNSDKNDKDELSESEIDEKMFRNLVNQHYEVGVYEDEPNGIGKADLESFILNQRKARLKLLENIVETNNPETFSRLYDNDNDIMMSKLIINRMKINWLWNQLISATKLKGDARNMVVTAIEKQVGKIYNNDGKEDVLAAELAVKLKSLEELFKIDDSEDELLKQLEMQKSKSDLLFDREFRRLMEK